MKAPCAWCTDRPTAGTVICGHCTKTLAVALANIAAYTCDLDTIRTRQARYGDPGPIRRGGGPLPLPVDYRFTDTWPDTASNVGAGSMLEADTRNTITGWARIVLDTWPPFPADDGWRGPVCQDCLHRSCNQRRIRATEQLLRRPPRDNLVSCCRYLQRLLPRIAAADWATQMLDELLNLEQRLRRFVDHPADQRYVGPCTAGLSGLAGAWICGADLYAPPDAAEVTCRDCNATYPVEQRHRWLLKQAEDEWHPATDIAHALVCYADDVSAQEHQLAARIRKWAERGRLVVRDQVLVKGQKCPRYRLGDVLDLVYEQARHAEEKAG